MTTTSINSTEKCLKNYLYDNPELREMKAKKSSCTEELEEDFDSNSEVWIFQCPKDVDPQNLINIELSKLGKQSKMECSADRFDERKILSVIAAEKTEYDMISDRMRLVQPIGKIIVSEKFDLEENTSQSAKRSMQELSPLKKKKSKRNQ